jgi:polar amino acid transport system substrate-binding protein
MQRFVIGLVAVVLVACQGGLALSSRANSGSPVIARIVKAGKLRVGMSGNQPPLNFKSKSGEIIGLDVDVARALAIMMGVELDIVQMPFGNLLGSLQKGDLDLVISGVTITPARNMKVPFVGPYMLSGKSILTKSSTLAKADQTDDLDDPKVTLVALAGSTSEDFVKAFAPRAKLVTTPDYDAAVALLLDGKADALVADYEICALTAFLNPKKGLVTLDRPLTVEPLGVAVAPGDPLFLNLIENSLGALDASQLFEGLTGRWIQSGRWVDQLP